MFGINEQGETCSILVDEYKPFFYVKVSDEWGQQEKNKFLSHLKAKVGPRYSDSVLEVRLIERKKLYGFDGGKNHRFLLIKFANFVVFNRAKNLWYTNYVDNERKLLKKGYFYNEEYLELYEANIPPLLRFFHIREVSPSGSVSYTHLTLPTIYSV